MLRKFLATALFLVSLHAQGEKFQIIANNVDTKNNIAIATGNVVIFSPSYYITAQKIIYDKNKGTFELFDDVVILKDNAVQTKSDYAFLDTNTDDLFQKPSMLFEQSNTIWINSKDSQKKSDTVFLDESVISSCDCVNPDWSLRVSSANYDTKDKWINAFNTRLYFKDLPVLYTPYIGFSTDTTRRTGLLIPTIGYSKREGGTYNQPIFIAPAPNYDLELIPQYKAKRGSGMYAYYRYADSPSSILEISTGYFNEKKKYQEENKLRNEEHYGLDINYERFNLFTGKKKDVKDGLYVDINYLNDIEYKTLQDDKNDDNEKEIESKINYVYNTPDYFLGSYFRYYIDTTKKSNGTTLQELPKLQAHSYTRPFIFDKLLYSSDVQFTNHKRNEGLNVNQYELNVPISYSYSLFDDYLVLSAKQEFVFNRFEYGNSDIKFKDGTYGETNTIIGLETDLIKAYENYLHTINLGVDYTHSKELKEDGDLYNVTNNNSSLSPFPVSKSSDQINIEFNQALYDSENLKQIIKHRVTQTIITDSNDDFEFQNLENEIVYNYILGSIKNRLVYNFQDDKLIESSSDFNLTYKGLYFKFGHYLSKATPNSGKEELESYQFDTKYKFSNAYSLTYHENYNVEKSIRTKQALSFRINDMCWDLDVKYEKEIEPASTTNGDPIKQDIVYVQLLLKNLGGILQEYEVNKE